MNNGNIHPLPQADIESLKDYFPAEHRDELFWGFTCHSRQEYASIVPLDAVDEIMLGVQCTEGGCLCELAFRWQMLGGKLVPRLEVFSEAWMLFRTPTFAAVMARLTQMNREPMPTPDELSALLVAHGFTDQSDQPLVIEVDAGGINDGAR